jgi:hypothetical protein
MNKTSLENNLILLIKVSQKICKANLSILLKSTPVLVVVADASVEKANLSSLLKMLNKFLLLKIKRTIVLLFLRCPKRRAQRRVRILTRGNKWRETLLKEVKSIKLKFRQMRNKRN